MSCRWWLYQTVGRTKNVTLTQKLATSDEGVGDVMTPADEVYSTPTDCLLSLVNMHHTRWHLSPSPSRQLQFTLYKPNMDVFAVTTIVATCHCAWLQTYQHVPSTVSDWPLLIYQEL